ncbi:MAG: hypothetical protein ACRCZR_01360 [Cetobacterium sp.]
MTFLNNLKLLEEENFLMIITSDLSISNQKLTSDEFYKIYSNDMKKLYTLLPIETYNFLKAYFENNNNTVPATFEYMECLNALKNYGIAEIDENHRENIGFTYDCVYGKNGGMEQTTDFFENLIKNKTSYPVQLDNEIAKSLLQFLDNNVDLVSHEKEVKDILIGIIKSEEEISLQELKDILKNKGLEVDNLLLFLKNKLSCGTIIIQNSHIGTEENEITIYYNNTHDLELEIELEFDKMLNKDTEEDVVLEIRNKLIDKIKNLTFELESSIGSEDFHIQKSMDLEERVEELEERIEELEKMNSK